MTTKKIVLLDLEETLIPIWGEFWPMANCVRIREHLNIWKPDEVITFSWAIWSEADKETFNRNKHSIEDAIGWKFTTIQSIEDIRDDLKKHMGLSFLTNEDFFDFFKRKESALFNLAVAGKWKNSDVMLWDDSVTECKMWFPLWETKVTVIKV